MCCIVRIIPWQIKSFNFFFKYCASLILFTSKGFSRIDLLYYARYFGFSRFFPVRVFLEKCRMIQEYADGRIIRLSIREASEAIVRLLPADRAYILVFRLNYSGKFKFSNQPRRACLRLTSKLYSFKLRIQLCYPYSLFSFSCSIQLNSLYLNPVMLVTVSSLWESVNCQFGLIALMITIFVELTIFKGSFPKFNRLCITLGWMKITQ